MTTDNEKLAAEQVKEAAMAIPDALWPFVPLPVSTVAEQVREAAAKVCDKAEVEADHKMQLAKTNKSRRNFAAAAVAACCIAAAIRAMPLPTTDRERLLRELERDARDSRFSDELIGNRFRAALTGAKP